MNASVVQSANLAPMSVEEMEMVEGGLIGLVVLAVVCVVAIACCNPPAAHAPTLR
jgi:hypothetical protein